MDDRTVVLVVEDHDDQRSLLKQALELYGYSVLASTGSDALEALSSTRAVECMIIDEYLGAGLRGSVMIKHARSMRPELRVVLMSALELAAEDVPEGATFLLKPYHVADIVSAIQDQVRTT